MDILQKQLQTVGRYNEELLEKYEPQSASSKEEEDKTEDGEEEDLTILGSVPGRKRVARSSTKEEVDPDGTEVTSTGPVPMELAASKEIGVGEVETQVEVATTEGGGEDEEWLNTIASTPYQIQLRRILGLERHQMIQ